MVVNDLLVNDGTPSVVDDIVSSHRYSLCSSEFSDVERTTEVVLAGLYSKIVV